MTTTFAVDDVVPAAELAPTIALRELVGEHAWLGGDPELRVLDEREVHPLLGAVHHAFAEHRPLVLTPDAVWLTIAQGVAHHVRLHADALRPQLVRHTGKRTLEVQRATRPDSAAGWAAIVSEFRAAVADAIGAGRARGIDRRGSDEPRRRAARELRPRRLRLLLVGLNRCDHRLQRDLSFATTPSVPCTEPRLDRRRIRRESAVVEGDRARHEAGGGALPDR